MTDRPIIFSAPMVRALLEGRKTQTRRILKPQPSAPHFAYSKDGRIEYTVGPNGAGKVIPFAHGDRLWVKETWRPSISAADPWHVAVLYPHDGRVKHWNWSSDADFGDWTIPKAAAKGIVTPLFMPRWASRLTLTVTDVRVQRLQDISRADCIAEGISAVDPAFPSSATTLTRFQGLWNSLHGPDAWAANPWVVAVSFTVQRGNIDQINPSSEKGTA